MGVRGRNTVTVRVAFDSGQHRFHGRFTLTAKQVHAIRDRIRDRGRALLAAEGWARGG